MVENKKKIQGKAWRCGSVIEGFPSIHETLGSAPSTTNKQQRSPTNSSHNKHFCVHNSILPFLIIESGEFGLANHPYGALPSPSVGVDGDLRQAQSTRHHSVPIEDVEWGKVGPVKCGLPSTGKACISPASCIIQQACFEHCYLPSSAHQNWMHSSICLTNICLTTVSSRMNKTESLLDVSRVGASLEKKSSSHACSLSCPSVKSELHTPMKSLEDCIRSPGNVVLLFLCPLL